MSIDVERLKTGLKVLQAGAAMCSDKQALAAQYTVNYLRQRIKELEDADGNRNNYL